MGRGRSKREEERREVRVVGCFYWKPEGKGEEQDEAESSRREVPRLLFLRDPLLPCFPPSRQAKDTEEDGEDEVGGSSSRWKEIVEENGENGAPEFFCVSQTRRRT